MKRLIQSVKHAQDGLNILVNEEPNYLIHLLATLLVLLACWLLRLSPTEWAIMILTITSVLITETINTSIENIMDFISTKRRAEIRKIKDLAAAAVLIASLGAVIIGLIILLPKIISSIVI